MRVEHHAKAFEKIISSYDGSMPLHRYLFSYFKQNKQMGSSDRKWASRYCYSYFRLGKALVDEERITRLTVADFLCNGTPSLIVQHYMPEWSGQFGLSVAAKIDLVKSKYPTFQLKEVFPFTAPTSEGLDLSLFQQSYFTQPDLFIRIKETHIDTIIKQLSLNGIEAEEISSSTLALPNGSKLEQALSDPRLYQIQDLSSQKTGEYFKPNANDYWWDCCAASGGKSLLLHSMEPKIDLLVSDIRQNSLTNLQERFQLAGIKKYQLKTMDLLQNNDQMLHHYEFDGILLDAPCSGSGTWGRTPEMLFFFEQYKIENYVKLQKAIGLNVVKYLKPGKPLIYMTCSVFRAENEDVVDFLVQNGNLELESMELIRGYDKKADSLFVARLIKRS